MLFINASWQVFMNLEKLDWIVAFNVPDVVLVECYTNCVHLHIIVLRMWNKAILNGLNTTTILVCLVYGSADLKNRNFSNKN